MANYQLEPPLPLDPLADFLTNTKLSDTERSIGLDVLSSAGALNNDKGAKLILAMLDAESWEVRGAAVAAADAIKLKTVGPKLITWAVDAKKPLEERIAALKALRSTGDAKTAEPLLMLLSGSDSSTLKAEVLRTVVVFAPESARKTAEQLLDQNDRSLLNEAVAILGSNKPGAKLIGERFVEGKLPKDMLPRVADAVRNFAGGDAAYTALYEKVMRGGLSLTGADVEKIKTQVAQRGNAARGRELYLSSTSLACNTCHRLEGVGGQIGPDLTRLWDTMTVEKILETIIEPSKEIKEGYQSYRATTNAGTVVTGLKISETPMEVVIREATGRDIRIAKSDLEDLSASRVSLMPENAISQLSYEQLLDLVAFLKSKREQESIRGAVREYSASFGPVSNPADPLANGTWAIKSVEPGGAWNWKAFGPGEAYAVTYVWSASKQNAVLSITTDDAVKIWVGGQPVFDRSVPKAGGFSGEEQVPVTWNAGWTPVLVKMVSPGAVNKLVLKAGGEGVRTAAKP
jgi:quinoprotein glucose dehydrogenase